ncbi:unnamed protein product [Linum tenue]|uniref:S-protein homolog n=1 Tax=Linum tenue TaxID=586396 RepID=A0AAV0L138_9ROSI|nr:unnamed protein product [Linum tenue]
MIMVVFATIMVIMPRPSVQDTVSITNLLTNKILIVHCRSKDDDLGGHAVDVGDSYRWSFQTNVFGGTLFWCNLAVQDKRISFKAYEEYEETFGMWFVHDDGLYGKPKHFPIFKMAAWKRP